jgi:hypothetical protein
MYRRAAILALFLQAVLQAVPQPPDTTPGPVILKSTSRAVQLDVFVSDPSGRPVHGLQKNDFVVTDNGHPRDIRIFAGEIEANRTPPSSAAAPPLGVYSNRLGMRDSRIVTAIVIDAVPRPDGLQKNTGKFASNPSEFWLAMVRAQAVHANRKNRVNLLQSQESLAPRYHPSIHLQPIPIIRHKSPRYSCNAMASQKQLEANRLNAAKSNGPRSILAMPALP